MISSSRRLHLTVWTVELRRDLVLQLTAARESDLRPAACQIQGIRFADSSPSPVGAVNSATSYSHAQMVPIGCSIVIEPMRTSHGGAH